MPEDYIEGVAAYIRVSTQEQKLHGLSLDAQRMKLREYADAHNLHIVRWYEDQGVSGRKLIRKRPALQQMINDAQSGVFKRIIFIKLDRFFRSVAEYHECMKRIEPVLWTATEEKYDLTTAQGRLMVNMKLTIAELEADQTAERIKLVNDYKVKSGRPVFPTRLCPFCYEVKTENGVKSIVKRNEEAMNDLLNYVFLNKSIHGGMNYINEKYNLGLLYKTVSAALRNEMICGTYRSNQEFCPPYISREDFKKLQDILSRSPKAAPKNTYLFTGLICCPECGSKMTGTQHTTTVKGKKYSYSVYRCPKHRRDNACGYAKLIFENKVEELLLLNVKTIMGNKQANVNSVASKTVNKNKLNNLHGELRRLNYMWQKGRIEDAEEYDRKYNDITAKIAAAQAEIEERTAKVDYGKVSEVLSSGWQDIYRLLDDEHKRAFWRSFIKEIHVKWGDGRNAEKEITDILFLDICVPKIP